MTTNTIVYKHDCNTERYRIASMRINTYSIVPYGIITMCDDNQEYQQVR